MIVACKRIRGRRAAPLRGYTLLELLVVIVIVGLLAAFVGAQYFVQLGKSKGQIAREQIDLFDKAVVQFRIDVGHYPSSEQGLVALVAPPVNEGLWHGPYLNRAIPLDPWGNAYGYRTSGADEREFEIYSFGRDGLPGGTGEDADVFNWQ
ncbi:type II secretion system major pseudopilin GspG [Rugamonas apoptosis]|uniref:Type II secretion system core protein G n=1 Tax=Rugamonas apoptosis TaxID=2758570 RepID=A0A7W2FE21_9BURK|nr:type II secretion system major pseudopilin GspG [Rugamonas apoptosis]MBA5689975.1 type II secretion system major pseudopilin GspG [Rugamonas apoptosis]